MAKFYLESNKRNISYEMITVNYTIKDGTKLSDTENSRVQMLLQKHTKGDIYEKYESFQEIFFLLITKTDCSDETIEKLNKKFSKEITNVKIDKEKNKFKKGTLTKAYQTMNTYQQVIYNILSQLGFKGEIFDDPFDDKEK